MENLTHVKRGFHVQPESEGSFGEEEFISLRDKTRKRRKTLTGSD